MLVSHVKTIKTPILSADLKNSKPTQSHVRVLQRQIQLKSNMNKVICNEVSAKRSFLLYYTFPNAIGYHVVFTQ